MTAEARREPYLSLREADAPLSHMRISKNYKALSAMRPAIRIALDCSKPSLSKRTPFANRRLTKCVGRESEMLIRSQ
jgi:hypothetical protein